MADDETLEEWSARRRRSRMGVAEPPIAVRIAAILFIVTGAISVAIGAPDAFRPVDLLGTRWDGILTILAGGVRIGLGVWLRTGSRRSYLGALLTSVGTMAATVLVFLATDGIDGAELFDLLLAAAPIALLLLPGSLRWRATLPS